MEHSLGLSAELLRESRLHRAARALTTAGAALAAARGDRASNALAGTALLAGLACTRLAIFRAGVASAADPKYVVVPQRDGAVRSR